MDILIVFNSKTMKSLRKAGLISIPLTFIFAGIGMIWLHEFDSASGEFFERLITNKNDWLGAHFLLLTGTVFLFPAALSIRLVLEHKIMGAIASALLLVIAFANVLLAGQYAIDFIMPLMAEVGGDALQVHGLVFTTPLINSLFYQLPNLVFLALFLLTLTLFWNKEIPQRFIIILLLNWLFVLTGNLIHPLFQRSAVLFLALSFMPLVYFEWKKYKADIR